MITFLFGANPPRWATENLQSEQTGSRVVMVQELGAVSGSPDLTTGNVELSPWPSATEQVPEIHATGMWSEWVNLLAHISQSTDASFTAPDIVPFIADAEALARLYFSRSKLVVATDEMAVYPYLHGLTPYVVHCTAAGLELAGLDNVRARAFAAAMRHADRVVCDTTELVLELKQYGVDAHPIADVAISDLLRKRTGHDGAASTPFDSLKQKRLEIEYEAQYGDFYDAKYHDPQCYKIMDEYLGQVIAEVVDERRGPEGPVRILDLGCGPGSLVPEITKNAEIDYVGVDVSASMISRAKARYPELEFSIGDAENLLFDDESFDVVICSGMLHHFPSVERVLIEVKRVLKVGGAFVCREPNEENFSKQHAEFAFLNLCLRNIIHVQRGSQAVIEPEEHEYHTDLDSETAVAMFSKHFWVASLFTSQAVSYFYDMLFEPHLRPALADLEDSINGYPGLNLILVCRKSAKCGASLVAQETLASLRQVADKLPAETPLRSLCAFYDAVVAQEAAPIFLRDVVSNPERWPELGLTSKAFIARDAMALNPNFQADVLPCISGDNTDWQVLDSSASLSFEDFGRFDHVRIVCDDAITADEIAQAASRCRDHGVVELVFKEGLKIEKFRGEAAEYLRSLSPLPAIASSSALKSEPELSTDAEVYHSTRFSPSLFTRKNFCSALRLYVEQSNFYFEDINTWLVEKENEYKDEFEVSLSSWSCSAIPIFSSLAESAGNNEGLSVDRLRRFFTW